MGIRCSCTLNVRLTSCIREFAYWSSAIHVRIIKHSFTLFTFASDFVSCITIELKLKKRQPYLYKPYKVNNVIKFKVVRNLTINFCNRSFDLIFIILKQNQTVYNNFIRYIQRFSVQTEVFCKFTTYMWIETWFSKTIVPNKIIIYIGFFIFKIYTHQIWLIILIQTQKGIDLSLQS